MQLSSDTILAFEFGVPCALMLVFAFSEVLGTRLAKQLMFALATVQLVAVAFRPDDYNSDTNAYYNYIDLLAGSSGNEILLATKFEPFHLALALITRDFRQWIFVENATAVVLLWVLFRKTTRLETLAVVLGCALPLFSSSVRFGIGLLTVACVLAIHRQERGRLWVSTLFGVLTHVSLVMVGVLQRRRWVLTGCILLGFVAYAILDEELGGRAGAGDDEDFKGAGTRSFVSVLLLMLYLRAAVPHYRAQLFRSDLLTAIGVFVLSMLFFPVVNRWLILLMLVIAVDAEGPLTDAKVARGTSSLASLALYAALMLPFLFKLGSFVGADSYQDG